MNEFQKMNDLTDLLHIFGLIIPEGIDKVFEEDGTQIHISKNNGSVKISVNSNKDLSGENFDDSSIKDTISEFKDNINDLDDSVFIESLEEARKTINVKRFDELLNLEKFTEAEATEVANMITYFSQIISNNLQEKIQELLELQERF